MTHCCKVGRVVAAHDLDEEVVGDDVDAYLTARWRGEEGYPETGLRPLTEWFNRTLVKRTYVEHGRSTLETRVDSEHEALTSDEEVTRGAVLDDLERDGIDGERLIEAFVSPTTLYRHLTDCLEVEKSNERPENESNWEEETVGYVRKTVRDNVQAALRSLENKGRIAGASEADVDVPVILSCPVCSTQVRFTRALDRGYVCEEHMGDAPDRPPSET